MNREEALDILKGMGADTLNPFLAEADDEALIAIAHWVRERSEAPEKALQKLGATVIHSSEGFRN